MSRCASCAADLPETSNLCPHHHHAHESGWAATNRIMCDFVHRGVVPSRLPTPQRDPDLRGCFQDAA